jgi:hypothetical protein
MSCASVEVNVPRAPSYARVPPTITPLALGDVEPIGAVMKRCGALADVANYAPALRCSAQPLRV